LRGRGARLFCLTLMLLVPGSRAAASAQGDAELRMEVVPTEATVGDRIQATLTLIVPANAEIDRAPLGPELGPFGVESESWNGPLAIGEGEQARTSWTWSGTLTTFRTGEVEVPAVRVAYSLGDGERVTTLSEPVRVEIRSVLDSEQAPEGEPEEIADIKAPASLRPDYSSLWAAAGVLALLLLGAVLLWWLQRRYAAKLSRVELPDDPFLRTPPHVWVYAELQKLLEKRLAEQGQFDLFYMELARIVKRYLSGRYRVELLEHTTAELPALLRQSRAPESAIQAVSALLSLADRVKFAGEAPDESSCRRSIEDAYEIVDATKSREEPDAVVQQGAA
jgi:hypothetical protein